MVSRCACVCVHVRVEGGGCRQQHFHYWQRSRSAFHGELGQPLLQMAKQTLDTGLT